MIGSVPELSKNYQRHDFVNLRILSRWVPPKVILWLAIKLVALMMNIKSGGRSWRILLTLSKLAISLSRIYFFYYLVMPSPNFLELLIVRYKNIIGKYSRCLWILRCPAYFSTPFLSDLTKEIQRLLKSWIN